MHATYIIRSLGSLLSVFSLSMLPPILVSIWYKDDAANVFFLSFLCVFSLGFLLWLPTHKKQYEPHTKEGFLIVVLFWLTLCLVGALPFVLIARPDLSLVDALFESFSGLTATGATVLTGLDTLPRSLLYYRQQLQFLGGMGVILLAIAILPTLGIGGMQLFRAEITGPTKDNKLTPRLAQSAKAIWMIYVGLTLFCAISYWAAGMELFDAIGYSFGTVSTGGYATHDLSIAYFDSPLIQLVAVCFMFLGGINFSLHFITVHHATLQHYLKDAEFRIFGLVIIVATLLITITLHQQHTFNDLSTTFISSLFHVVSLCTTTGFSAADYQEWPLFVPILLLLLGIVGGCAGSTSGGIKMVRLLLLHKQGAREINRLIHPNAHYIIKFGRTPLSDRIINAIWGFLATYCALFGLFLILLQATGLDFTTAYSATAAALSNIGPGLGKVSDNYHAINDAAKVLLSFAMLIGRLELFTVLVLFTPVYWRT